MSPDPLTPAQAAREFSAPPDDVPAPAPTDPAADPPGTLRVESWERRLDPAARRVMRVSTDVASGYPWRGWVQITGAPRTDLARSGTEWLSDDEVGAWPVATVLTLAVTFRHAAHERSVAQARAYEVGAAMARTLDGSDAEGAAPFRDARDDPRIHPDDVYPEVTRALLDMTERDQRPRG